MLGKRLSSVKGTSARSLSRGIEQGFDALRVLHVVLSNKGCVEVVCAGVCGLVPVMWSGVGGSADVLPDVNS